MRLSYDIVRLAPAVLAGFALFWCGFYLLGGESNFFTLHALKLQQASLEKKLDELHEDRLKLEDKVVRMRPNSLDWDLVEQQAQINLGPATKGAKSLNM